MNLSLPFWKRCVQEPGVLLRSKEYNVIGSLLTVELTKDMCLRLSELLSAFPLKPCSQCHARWSYSRGKISEFRSRALPRSENSIDDGIDEIKINFNATALTSTVTETQEFETTGRNATTLKPNDYIYASSENFNTSNDDSANLTTCIQTEVDLVILMDSSGSSEPVFDEYKRIASRVIETVPISHTATLVSLIQYSTYAIVRQWFDVDQTTESVVRLIQNLELKGGVTETADAVALAMRQFDFARRLHSRKLIIMFTDGNSNDPWLKAVSAASALHTMGAQVIIYADGNPLGESEIKLYVGTDGIVVHKGGEDHLYKKTREFAYNCTTTSAVAF
ncbi:unnamed protein product [Soboliphyme baturini]|uniref:VWFA domain-containing protein n=1 Tax=Soboliphyme baturini TaxID=241478 RepID=A0A183IWM4_9BILA|nr:unnamed protein product [Soboliphyme baturini]